MFFERPDEIKNIAERTSCAIFVMPTSFFTAEKVASYFRHPEILSPDQDKATPIISINALREFIAHANSISTSERFLAITHADTMNEAAQNAFLKTFEEPKQNYHFVLFTDEPGALLPTIKSRAQIYYLRTTGQIDAAPNVSAEVVALAKKLVTAEPAELPNIAEKLAKAKPKPREQALLVVSTATEILYKSYFKTNNEKFLTKIPNFLKLYDNLANNGHVKLHIVADLL